MGTIPVDFRHTPDGENSSAARDPRMSLSKRESRIGQSLPAKE
jgi:hypothetical protein